GRRRRSRARTAPSRAGRGRRGGGRPGRCPRGADAPSARRAARSVRHPTRDPRRGRVPRTPSPCDLLQAPARGVGKLGGDLPLLEELLVDDRRRVGLLERHQARGGAEERAAAGSGLGRDVRGRHEVLDRRGIVPLALVRLTERVGGVGRVGPVGAPEEFGEDRARLARALVLGEQARVAQDLRLAPLAHTAVLGGARVRVDRAGAVAGRGARPGQQEPRPQELRVRRRRRHELLELPPRPFDAASSSARAGCLNSLWAPPRKAVAARPYSAACAIAGVPLSRASSNRPLATSGFPRASSDAARPSVASAPSPSRWACANAFAASAGTPAARSAAPRAAYARPRSGPNGARAIQSESSAWAALRSPVRSRSTARLSFANSVRGRFGYSATIRSRSALAWVHSVGAFRASSAASRSASAACGSRGSRRTNSRNSRRASSSLSCLSAAHATPSRAAPASGWPENSTSARRNAALAAA